MREVLFGSLKITVDQYIREFEEVVHLESVYRFLTECFLSACPS